MIISEIGKEFYHFKSGEPLLHRNIYVKRFIAEDGAAGTMVLDPGAKPDAPVLRDALTDIAGGVGNVDLVFLSHQDPDVAGNAKFIIDNSAGAVILASADSRRLLGMMGLPDNRFYVLESSGVETVEIKRTGHRILPVPAYYCHFRGSMMLYDIESRVLFSGDFLGGVNTRKGSGIYADETSWDGISLFHQIYMPANRAVRETIGRILEIKPFPEVIAPQHGDVIKGAFVKEFLDRLSKLDVGVDLVKLNGPEKTAGLKALNGFFQGIEVYEPAFHETLWGEITRRDDFTTIFKASSHGITDIKVSLSNAVVYLCKIIDGALPEEHREKAKILLAVALEENGLEMPYYCLTGERVKADILDVPA
jgi:glyoxylase-like metal-dependent hydrolase (beta-lactamase superfamily II)